MKVSAVMAVAAGSALASSSLPSLMLQILVLPSLAPVSRYPWFLHAQETSAVAAHR